MVLTIARMIRNKGSKDGDDDNEDDRIRETETTDEKVDDVASLRKKGRKRTFARRLIVFLYAQ